MANKRVTATTDPLVVLHIYVPKSQKDYLDSLDGSASEFFRKLISAQMSGHDVEIAKLKEELKEYETHANIIRAQIAELEAENDKQQDDIAKREQLINDIVENIVDSLTRGRGKYGYVKRIEESIRKRVKVANDWLATNKPGIPPITFDEVNQAVIEGAKSQGVKLIYD